MKGKKTKIICTVSDRNCSSEFIASLYAEGMNVVRINSAHAGLEAASEIVRNTRAVSDKIAILIDTKGPEIRLTALDNDTPFSVSSGETVRIKGDPSGLCSREMLYVNYSGMANDIPDGATILIDDGDISMTVIGRENGSLVCRIDNDGVIKGRKSVNVPGVSMKLPALTEKDRSFIEWAIDEDIDFVAHSFVRSAEDLQEINRIIERRNSHLKIISKIENQEGVDNIDEILESCYGIMVARGDLGVEIAAEKIPIIQKMLVDKCRRRKKPVIIATQMLHTMIENPRPTRAEISDVANAVFEYTDAIMLSGETANGKYPVEAVKTMARIAYEVESKHSPDINIEFNRVTEPTAVVLARAMVEASCELPIKCIIIDTYSGRTGRYLSAFRPNIPVYAKCYKPHVQRELALSYGIYADITEPRKGKDEFVKYAVMDLLDKKTIEKEDLIGVLAGSFGHRNGASFIEISSAENQIAAHM